MGIVSKWVGQRGSRTHLLQVMDAGSLPARPRGIGPFSSSLAHPRQAKESCQQNCMEEDKGNTTTRQDFIPPVGQQNPQKARARLVPFRLKASHRVGTECRLPVSTCQSGQQAARGSRL